MKAIYINLDPYLAAFAAWLKGGKSGPAPRFDPLPLAVTIPLGESAAVYCVGNTDGEGADFVVGDTLLNAAQTGALDPSGEGQFVATNITPGLSAYETSDGIGQKYAVAEIQGNEISTAVRVADDQGDTLSTISFTVLVRRETASGPVDLVDFTPPASGGTPSAADIRSALVAAGDGALEGVKLGGAILLAPPSAHEPDDATQISNGVDSFALEYLLANEATKVLGSSSGS